MSLTIDCFKINGDINDCNYPNVGDYKQVGVMFPHEDITNITYDNCTVNFDLKVPSAVKIYDRSFMPFKGSGVTEEAKERFLSLTDNVMIPLIDMTPENAFVFQKMAINNQRWVVILGIDKGNETDKNLFQVFGIETGLYVKSKQTDKANQAYLAVSMVQPQSKYPDLFFFDTNKTTTETKIDSWLGYEVVYGGKTTSGAVIMTINSELKGYAKLPNGTVKQTTLGVLDSTYSGYEGDITYFVKAGSDNLYINGTPISGEVKCDVNLPNGFLNMTNSEFMTSIIAPYIVDLRVDSCTLLNSIYAPLALSVSAKTCALTAKAIGDLLYNAYLKNYEGVNYDFTLGNNALQGAVDTYLQDTYNGLTYNDVYELLVTDNSGTILIDSI